MPPEVSHALAAKLRYRTPPRFPPSCPHRGVHEEISSLRKKLRSWRDQGLSCLPLVISWRRELAGCFHVPIVSNSGRGSSKDVRWAWGGKESIRGREGEKKARKAQPSQRQTEDSAGDRDGSHARTEPVLALTRQRLNSALCDLSMGTATVGYLRSITVSEWVIHEVPPPTPVPPTSPHAGGGGGMGVHNLKKSVSKCRKESFDDSVSGRATLCSTVLYWSVSLWFTCPRQRPLRRILTSGPGRGWFTIVP